MPAFKDLTGQKFGRLTALNRSSPPREPSKWLCSCECGGNKEVRSCHLISGTIKSCGCINKENGRARFTTHGLNHVVEHTIWNAMKMRCSNPNNVHYHNYGGRGITVCEEWMHDFVRFYTDMGSRPSSNHSIDRMDNDGNYEPSNCRWATREEQQNNTRQNIKIPYMGETKSMTEWSRSTGIPFAAIQQRYHKGWSPEKILTKKDWRSAKTIKKKS